MPRSPRNYLPRTPPTDVRLLLWGLLWLLGGALRADPGSGESIRDFDLAVGRAPVTLARFAAQAGPGPRLLYSLDAVEGVLTRAVRGRFTPREALERLMEGTPLTVVEDPVTGALAVERLPPAAGSAPPPPAPTGPPRAPGIGGPVNDEVIRLIPFEVSTDPDGSYGALQSSALTAFSLDLQKMPAAAQVFTETFMRDANALTIEDMLINYSAVVGFNPADAGAYTSSVGDRDSSTGLSIRGFGGSGIRFDGFFGPATSTRNASGATPTFAIERVELIEGPQSLLYGAVGGGGVINAVSKRAMFGVVRGSAYYGFSDLGSKYATVDYNVGSGRFALRLAALSEDSASVRQNLGSSTQGIYAQAAFRLGSSMVVRLLHGKYETVATNGFNPSLKPFLAPSDPRLNNSAQWFAATGQVPAGIFGGKVDWKNIDSFAGWWAAEPITNDYSTLIVEANPLPWLSVKVNAIYNEMTDWRNSTTLTLEPAGVAGNPYGGPAIQAASPNLNFQSQRQKGVQVNLVATHELLHGAARSQTMLGGYLNHAGPSFGSSGITYSYVQADANWNPAAGGGTADYGRILMPNQFIPIAGGQIAQYPLFRPGRARVSLNGVNYVLVPRIVQSAAFKGFPLPGVPANPYGLVPNGSNNLATGSPSNYNFNGLFNPGTEEHERYLDLGNYTDWLGGRFQTLVGLSLDRAISQNTGASNVAAIPWKTYAGYEIGVIYQLTPTLGVYANLGTAATPSGSTHDLFGNSLSAADARSPVPELGLKAHSRDQRYSAQLSWDIATRDRNEIQAVDGSYQNAVNPSGINGRYGGANTNNFVNVDRTSTALELLVTADPAREWRVRFSLSSLFSRIAGTVAYPQLYNDQFRVNPAGQVTYQNGAPVYVNGAAADPATALVSAAGSPGAVPLTLGMIGNPASPYYAQPSPTSGAIGNPALRTILTGGDAAGAALVAANGAIATGATGLPLSQAQYAFTSPFPNNTVTVFSPGNLTTGYPGWQWNLSSDYTLARGPLRGLGLYLSGVAQYSTRAFYVFYPGAGADGTQQVNESRVLDTLPTIARFDLGLHYTMKLGRSAWTTRLLINNLFNHDRLYVLPQAANGTFLQVTQRTPPRLWSWTNEVDF